MTSSRRGFTLIELLVVIAIIAMLISILLPSLKGARESARAVISMANLKQQGQAIFGYHSENKDYWPGDHYEGQHGSWIAWAPRIRFYIGREDTVTQVFYCPSTPSDFKWRSKQFENNKVMPQACTELGYNDMREKGLLYTANIDPSNPGANKVYFGYGYNGWGAHDYNAESIMLGLGGHTDSKFTPLEPGRRWEREVKQSDIVIPANMIALADSIGDGAWDTWISPQGWNPTLKLGANSPGPRHSGRSNVMMGDFAVMVKNPRDLQVNDPSISANEKLRRIEMWNRQGKSITKTGSY